MAIPEDIANEIMKIHDHPCAWWVGQFAKYLLRPNQEFANSVAKMDHPIVGIHVRRGDKLIREAKFYPLDNYLEKVEGKIIYLASDDSSVFKEARENYRGS